MRPKLVLVAALAENRVIGLKGDLPWRLRSDLKHFKAITQFKPVIMGARTWESLPRKPLPGRLNIILSRSAQFEAHAVEHGGAVVCETLSEALEIAYEHAEDDAEDEVCVIGGASLYEACLPKAHRLYLTRVHAKPEGDTHFPEFDAAQWTLSHSEFHAHGEGDDFDFTTEVYDLIKL